LGQPPLHRRRQGVLPEEIVIGFEWVDGQPYISVVGYQSTH
jgi:hypothetical protein